MIFNYLDRLWQKPSMIKIYNLLIKINLQPSEKKNFLFFATLLSIYSLHLIPFTFEMNLPAIGFDFANPYLFQNCPIYQDSPYLVSGKTCGDLLSRDMIYPPLLYWFYFWVRDIPFGTAYSIWIALIIGVMFLSIWVQQPRPDRITLSATALFFCLLPQLPMVFAIERGNNDFLIVLIWSLLILAWRKNQFFVAGLLAGLSFMLKIYPLFAIVPITLGFLASSRTFFSKGNINVVAKIPFFFGCATSIIVLGGIFYSQNLTYYTQVLPQWMGTFSERHITVHSIYSIIPGSKLTAFAAGLMLLTSWSWISTKKLNSDPDLVLSGALAISTYFSSVSNDYNLITTFPLIALCWFRSENHSQKNLYFTLFATSFLGPIGLRWLWKNQLLGFDAFNLVFQIFWLTAFIYTCRNDQEDLKA